MSSLLQRILPLRLSEHKKRRGCNAIHHSHSYADSTGMDRIITQRIWRFDWKQENAAGLGLQCTYLTARGTSTVQYLHTKSGFLGITDCPLLRKSNIVVDNG